MKRARRSNITHPKDHVTPVRVDVNTGAIALCLGNGSLYYPTDDIRKLLWRLDRPDDGELYDLVNDLDELQNLFDAASMQVQHLHTNLRNLEPFRTTPFPARGLPQDESAMRALESLGYVRGSPTSAPASRRPLPDAPDGDAPTPFTGSDPNSTSREAP